MSDRAMLAGMRIRVNPKIDAVLTSRLFARGRLPACSSASSVRPPEGAGYRRRWPALRTQAVDARGRMANRASGGASEHQTCSRHHQNHADFGPHSQALSDHIRAAR